MRIRVRFFGRRVGAIGLKQDFKLRLKDIPEDATSMEVSKWLRVYVYETHEHISALRWLNEDRPEEGWVLALA